MALDGLPDRFPLASCAGPLGGRVIPGTGQDVPVPPDAVSVRDRTQVAIPSVSSPATLVLVVADRSPPPAQTILSTVGEAAILPAGAEEG